MVRPRIPRVEELIKVEVGKIIQFAVKDPRLEFATVCRTKVSKDLRHALIFVSFLDDRKAAESMQALEGAKGFIRKLLGERIRLRFLPEIKFIHDDNAAYALRISQLIDEVTAKPDPPAREEQQGDTEDESADEP